MGRDISDSDKTKPDAADVKQAQVFDDQQAAIAGRSTGRILPRLGKNAPDARGGRDKKHADTVELLTNLQLMMQDPEYAALYNDTKTNDKPNGPSHEAFSVREGKNDKSYFNRVGVAFEHKDGKGFNIDLEAVPVNGRIVLRTPSERLKDSKDGSSRERSSQARERD